MNLLRILGWNLGFVRLCVLKDFDGELSLRVIRKGPGFGTPGMWARRMSYSCLVQLLPDGRINGPSFVTEWHSYPWRDTAAEEVDELEQLLAGSLKKEGE